MYYIDTDGKTVLRGNVFDSPSLDMKTGRRIAGILLSNGMFIHDDDLQARRLFATHPDTNPNLKKDQDGVYHYKGATLRSDS